MLRRRSLFVRRFWVQILGSRLHRNSCSTTVDVLLEQPYREEVAKTPHVSQEAITAAVDEVIAKVLPADLGDTPHLPRAVIAGRIAAVAAHLSKSEVAAARDRDGASWYDVPHAFGISPHNESERFRTALIGLPQ